MEDIFAIVWIAVVVAITAVSSVNKRRKRAESSVKSVQNIQSANRRPTFVSSENRSIAAYDERSDLQRADSTTEIDPMTVDDSAGSESQADMISAETFDVKRAVIYAEILRPKFKE